VIHDDLKLITDPDHPSLRVPCVDVAFPWTRVLEFTGAMRRIMRAHRGIGLAAPQVGHSLRVILVQDRTLINPRVTCFSRRTSIDKESCLSILGKTCLVRRWNEVTVEYADEGGHPRESTMAGYVARILQHELDHLNGVLITDPDRSPAQRLVSPN